MFLRCEQVSLHPWEREHLLNGWNATKPIVSTFSDKFGIAGLNGASVSHRQQEG